MSRLPSASETEAGAATPALAGGLHQCVPFTNAASGPGRDPRHPDGRPA